MKGKILILLVMILFISGCTSSFTKELTVAQTKTLLEKNEEILIIDVRTREEYNGGHIKGAILIPHDELYDRLDEIKEYKNKPILVYCRTQNRSEEAEKILKENGFNQIYQMIDGFSQW